jgi:peptidoglycan/xylan/chitin deacetylase (PgdA/CDA1 family)
MYHSISDAINDPYSVSINEFQEQVAWLLGNKFDIVPLSVLEHAIRKNDYSSHNKKVILTFDDGYLDFVTNALPILLRYGATATVFLVTDMIGGHVSWKKNGEQTPLMSMDDLHYIKTKKISLGSHTATHANLTILDDKQLHKQLSNSYQRLTALGESFYALSYPWGQWTAKVAKAVEASGYSCATVAEEPIRLSKMDKYRIPRIVMGDDTDFDSFKAIFNQTPLTRTFKRYSRVLKRLL